jgi:hypothetical protein
MVECELTRWFKPLLSERRYYILLKYIETDQNG